MGSWKTAAQIADRWPGVLGLRVARIAHLLGLDSSSKHVKNGAYSAAAVGLIERELQSRGYSRELET